MTAGLNLLGACFTILWSNVFPRRGVIFEIDRTSTTLKGELPTIGHSIIHCVGVRLRRRSRMSRGSRRHQPEVTSRGPSDGSGSEARRGQLRADDAWLGLYIDRGKNRHVDEL